KEITKIITSNNEPYLISKKTIYSFNKETYFPFLEIDLEGDEFITQYESYLGNDLVGTNKGLYLIQSDHKSKICSGYIGTLFKDKENHLWVSSIDNGLFKISQQKGITFTFGESKFPVYEIEKSKDRKILFIGDNGYFGKKTENNFTLENTSIENSLRGRKIETEFAEAYLFQNCIRINNTNYRTPFGALKTFTFISEDSLLIASNNGVYKVRYEELASIRKKASAISNNNQKQHYLDQFKIFETRTHALLFNKKNNTVYLGSNEGLFGYSKNKIYAFNDPLLKKRITDLKFNNSNELIIATSGYGLLLLNENGLIQISTKDGLTSNIINKVFIDTNSNLWLSTNKGINKITGTLIDENYTISYFNNSDGLPSNIVNATFVYNDTIWAGTEKGITFFNEKDIKFQQHEIPIKINSISINDKSTAIDSLTSLKHNQNKFSINFIGIAPYKEGKITYEYQLSGIDSLPQYTNSRSITFRALPPGDYNLRLKVKDDSSVNNPVKNIAFTIKKPLWEESWVTPSVIILAIIILVSILLYNYKRNKKRQKQLEKIRALEKLAFQQQMNPHFIFNALNSIHDFIGSNDQKSAHQYLSKFAKLIRYSLDNSVKDFVSINSEIDFLKLYLALEDLRFENLFDYEVNLNSEEILSYQIPPMILQPYIENAILHGIRHKKNDKGRIIMNFSKLNNHIEITIDDNGIGRKKSSAINSKKEQYHKSSGMNIAKERLENSHKKKLSTIQVIDKYDSVGNPEGTLVKICIPIDE
ncbi:MAG: histidine kinase, partial [Flavobacteriaceae bacterium]|nr:histidine kinase [Flavobacteriaceae bacterium]